ncbi:MAG: AAA family ATPase [Deltaproteobacteria bacterium]|nr:AAA family ATPase [Deltaproteobacteria bacterium]
MRLIRTRIENFKLLEDVSIDFSVDAKKPLTVVRAENGSGKTSLLYALQWAFYGLAGLPESARSLRLSSSALRQGTPATISVMVEFEHTDDSRDLSRYRLVRTVTETPGVGDAVERKSERVRLLRITTAGEEDVAAADTLIAKFLPPQMQQVFFTNGDAVQTFISGQVNTTARKTHVQALILSLLGIDSLRLAVKDLAAAHKVIRGKAAESGGADTSELEKLLQKTVDEELEVEAKIRSLTEALSNMTEQKGSWERELNALRGIGDLDELNERIETAERARRSAEIARDRALGRMRAELKSEECSWMLLGSTLSQGVTKLSELADRNVIPGPSIEVLIDRLEMKKCICGEPLELGSSHRATVEKLCAEQQTISVQRQRLTQLFHTARQAKTAHEARVRALEWTSRSDAAHPRSTGWLDRDLRMA